MMDPKKLAIKLYDLAKDMDAMDYADTTETDTEKLSSELSEIQRTMPELFAVLEILGTEKS